MKQTAVEWLADIYSAQGNLHVEDIQQAREMEREQIETAYISGRDDWQSYQVQIRTHEPKKPNPVKYYNETYGGDK